MTHGRRAPPIEQIKCIGGSARCRYIPDVIQCKNVGTDGYDVQWDCSADMSDEYRFNRVSVSCEGYDDRDDPYILRGSCGLEVSIDITEKGRAVQDEERYRNRDRDYSSSSRSHYSSSSSQTTIFGTLIQFLAIFLIIYIIYRSCSPNSSFSNGGGGSSGWGGGPGGGPSTSAYNPDYFKSAYTPTSSSSGPGFWSGAAAGAGLGYLLGNRNTSSGRSYTASSFNSGASTMRSDPAMSTTTRSAHGFGGTTRR
eukprot:TRINITY_DN27220_c0_g2_i1.p1 TRINITY_DN27220_c0_g2~~TRINITY_DN27220_c0_g2_i1.p1  ORF type:complete len:278 (-),score=14.89 TRINITY_DN27220_c0_g2_i1:96-854(-)